LDQQIQKPIDPDQRQKSRPAARNNLPAVSALAQKQAFALHQPMSLWSKADMCSAKRHVRFIPKSRHLDFNQYAG